MEIFSADTHVEVALGADGSSLNIYVSSNQSYLPADMRLAMIAYSDGDRRYSWYLSSDGGGVMVLIDEF